MSADREPIRYFIPGPVYVLEETRRAMTRPIAPHRAPEFRAVWDAISAALPPLFRTARPAMVATGSSTLLMEAALHLARRARRSPSRERRFLGALAGGGAVARPFLGRGRSALGRGAIARPGARRAAPQEVRGGHAGAQRDLDRSAGAAGRAGARGARGERRASPGRHRLVARRGAGRDRRLGPRSRLRRRAEGNRRASRAHRLHFLGARRAARRAGSGTAGSTPTFSVTATSSARAVPSRPRRSPSAMRSKSSSRGSRARGSKPAGGGTSASRRPPLSGRRASAATTPRRPPSARRPSPACVRPPASSRPRWCARRRAGDSRSAAATAASRGAPSASAIWERWGQGDLAALLAALEEEIRGWTAS